MSLPRIMPCRVTKKIGDSRLQLHPRPAYRAEGTAPDRMRRPQPSSIQLSNVDHVLAREGLSTVACAHDLGGIVGKLASGRYHADGTSTNWCENKNPRTRR